MNRRALSRAVANTTTQSAGARCATAQNCNNFALIFADKMIDDTRT